MAVAKIPPPEFLSIDLEISSKSDLQPLVAAFGQDVLKFGVGESNGIYGARLQLAMHVRSADDAIRRFCALVDALPARHRKHWDKAKAREFNIGVVAPENPFCHQFALAAESVKAAAGVGARIVFTIYAPDTQLGKKSM